MSWYFSCLRSWLLGGVANEEGQWVGVIFRFFDSVKNYAYTFLTTFAEIFVFLGQIHRKCVISTLRAQTSRSNIIPYIGKICCKLD